MIGQGYAPYLILIFMKIQNLPIYMTITAITVCSCGPSKEEKARQDKAEQEKIEALAKQKADSIVRIEQEKQRIEDEKRAEQERQAQLEQEQTEYAEERAGIWTGATSIEELESKLDGTTWTSKPNLSYGGLMYKFVFSNGIVSKYCTRAKNGCWNNDCIKYRYTIQQKRDSNGAPFAAVKFGDGSNLDNAQQTIAFIDHCQRAVWFIEGNMAGELTFGDYQWEDDL